MIKLSVVISAFNEEKKIVDCLESVSFADEIIVVDNESSDRTADLSKKYATKVYSQPNNLMLNVNKNYGFSKATGEWILSLDADERITPDLADEIKKVISPHPDPLPQERETVGYWIPRKNVIFGKWMQHTGWYPDLNLRLFKQGKGKFPEKHVHEKIEVKGKTESLTEPMIHYNYETIAQFIHKHMIIYAPNEAEQLLKQGYEFNFIDAIRFPFNEFLSRYFAREGYKDGFHGLVISLLLGFYHLMIFCYIWEKNEFAAVENKNILEKTEIEMKKVKKELQYWFLTEKIKQSKSFGRKLWLKLWRKLNGI